MAGRTRLALPAAAAFLLLALAAPLAAAHAEVEHSEPAQGARLDAAPAMVMVRLSEAIEPSATTMVVVDTAGTRIDRGDLHIEEGAKPVLMLSLQEDVPPGAYAIVWKTLSRTDGHPSGDRIGFAVGDFEPPVGSTAAAWPPALAVAGRALAFVGLAIAFGAAAWLWYVRADLDGARPTAQRALLLGAAVHTVGILLLMRATSQSTGLGPAELAASQVGRLLSVRLVAGLGALLLAGLAALPRNPARLGAPLAAILMAAAGVASSAIGHPAGEGLPGMAVDAMHLFASATWVGGLVLLVVALTMASRRGLPAEQVRRIGLRFGTLALVCVIVLFLAGSIASLLILGRDALLHPLGLLDGLYGRLLVAKVALAALMVALAAANRYVFLEPHPGATGLQARVASLGPDGTTKGLRRTVTLEASVGVVVLVLAAFLTAVSPEVQADAGADTAAAFADGAIFHYHLAFDPAPAAGGRSGLTLAIIDLSTGDHLENNTCGRDSCVQVTVAPAGQGTEGGGGSTYVLVPDGQGHWTVPDVLWTFAGPATAVVQAQTAVSEDSAMLSFTIA
ncbi:MAG: copper transport protein [Thermoplasmata archaeon]|nr:copper transport protein [Thermoplasmata archaeon]